MELPIIQIGNSKGFRLSKTLILEKEYIVLKPISQPRKDWEKAFKEMNEKGDDQLLFNDVFEDENLEEWN